MINVIHIVGMKFQIPTKDKNIKFTDWKRAGNHNLFTLKKLTDERLINTPT